MTAEKPIHFPPFRLEPAERRLYRGTTPVALRPKTFAVLHHLLRRPGRLVTKEELLGAVWPDTAVGDAVLKVSVRELREALGDDSRSPRFIETAQRAGYRFIGEVARSNLPVHLSSFVGREGETTEIGRLLGRARLVTLTGPGGSGKTRLAAEVAGEATCFPDGACWVELASLSDPALVAQTVLSALGLQEQPGRPHLDTLALHLQSRCLLLVLDNCEHLLASCATLAEGLLRAGPALKILATSREPLGVPGETVWQVRPLSLPETDDPLSPEEQMRYGAVRLFVERARSVQPTFDAEASGGALVRVCRRLDGLPLAIELAAPRLTLLSLEELAGRLDRGLRTLRASGPRPTARHQTLQATIDWSYGLLTERERVFLGRLSVFAGGWSLPAAEQVCGGDGVAPDEVFELLARLVDKSLVLASRHEGQTRYRLLETVRQYGEEKLAASGDAPRVRRRHAEYYGRSAEEMAARINTPARTAVLAALGHEHDNLRAALRLAAETGDTSAELSLCHSLHWFWFHRGHWSEGRAWLAHALERSATEGRTRARGRALAHDGALGCFMGDPTAQGRLEESVAIHRELGDRLDLGDALRSLVFAVGESDPARARRLAEESLALYREGGPGYDLALALAHVGAAAYMQEDYDAARLHYEQSAALCRELADDWLLALPLAKLGLVAMRQGDLGAAAARLRESVTVQRDVGERWFLSRCIEGLARVLAAQGRHERAARLLGAGESLRDAVGATVIFFDVTDQDRARASLRDALGEDAFTTSYAQGRALTFEQTISCALAQGDADDED